MRQFNHHARINQGNGARGSVGSGGDQIPLRRKARNITIYDEGRAPASRDIDIVRDWERKRGSNVLGQGFAQHQLLLRFNTTWQAGGGSGLSPSRCHLPGSCKCTREKKMGPNLPTKSPSKRKGARYRRCRVQ